MHACKRAFLMHAYLHACVHTDTTAALSRGYDVFRDVADRQTIYSDLSLRS